MKEILENIKNDILNVPPKGRGRSRFFLENKKIIIESYNWLNENSTGSEILYCLLNDIEKPKCLKCGKIPNFDMQTKKYRKYCCISCADTCEEKKSKVEKTFIERYGVSRYTNPQKAKQTSLEKYGVEHYTNNEQTKKTKLERYGYHAYNNIEQIKKTKQKKYGNYNYNNIEKCKKTCLEKYGIEFYRNHAQRRLTMLERYGVENPMQVQEFFDKQQKSAFKWKEYILPSGNIIVLQGYENKALDELLKSYDELDIVMIKANVPMFWYTFNDKNKKYYPDFYIPKDNLIIEVKSFWTYNKELEKNILKEASVINQGYNFRLMIF